MNTDAEHRSGIQAACPGGTGCPAFVNPAISWVWAQLQVHWRVESWHGKEGVNGNLPWS